MGGSSDDGKARVGRVLRQIEGCLEEFLKRLSVREGGWEVMSEIEGKINK